jgi:cytochrome c oxidase subunit 2
MKIPNTPRFRRIAAGAAALGALGLAQAALAAVKPEAGIGLPHDVSSYGYRIDWLMNVTHVFNIILFVIMCVWMAIAIIKHNKHHTAEYDHGNSKRSMTIALCISALIFLVVDGNLFVNTLIDLDGEFWNFSKVAQDPNRVRIEINGHQWAWDARYPGEDGKFNTDDDIVTWNDIKVPSGKPIHLQLSSTDVIHSFYLPNFRTKMDAVPGQINQMWFQAGNPEKPETLAAALGEYDIGCAQHCGTHHYKMKGMLTVLSPEDFAAWAKEASTNAKRAYDPEDKTAHWGWEWKEIQ